MGASCEMRLHDAAEDWSVISYTRKVRLHSITMRSFIDNHRDGVFAALMDVGSRSDYAENYIPATPLTGR